MIGPHIRAVSELFATIQTLADQIDQMPDGKAKFQLELLVAQMQTTAEGYADNSLDLYDGLLKFAMTTAVAR